ncbi:hypothetical protein HPC49_10145 [Pyxidicoccus fallax]|uniref:Uncharacterized protein n=1 Tax=Pyxidicoccus fallax TaxID=394095 RepID=A0A346D7C2_9BACT|nr:hypothetical protein [Pyxidicoccus fallax]AXM42937.1 hypothetical protein [Pyxidicoccus fallax]NMO18048.1 hypothetical protein [Pyxidicoccus fallax]NPC78602.1 hypothetical protein [Pyxidicoccus fallax]
MERAALEARLFTEQELIQRRKRRAAWLFGILALIGVSVAAVTVLPHWRMKARVGKPLQQVERELGAPIHRWTKEEFHCRLLPSFPCRKTAPAEGPVLFYKAGFLWYYLYFDSANVLVEVEPNGS